MQGLKRRRPADNWHADLAHDGLLSVAQGLVAGVENDAETLSHGTSLGFSEKTFIRAIRIYCK